MHADHIHANDFNIREEAFEIMIELDLAQPQNQCLTKTNRMNEGRWTDRRAVISGRDGLWGVLVDIFIACTR
jgi:hypothetical protein